MVRKRVLVVTGPTGVGKTDFVLKLATAFPAEIVNADIGQMYAPLNIGTAKPVWQNEPTPHHLFDNLVEPKDFSVVQFRASVAELVQEIWARGKTPIIVGGSTLYIKALFFPPIESPEGVCPPDKGLLQTDTRIGAHVSASPWQALHEVDPIRAMRLHPNDIYRINRALEIWQRTGVQPSNLVPQFAPLTVDMQLFILNSPKGPLYARIDKRVVDMMRMGWVAETEKLNADWCKFLRYKKIIGYELILDFLEQKITDQAQCVTLIQQRVRNYAKKQQTFWRSLQKALALQSNMHKNVFEINLTLLDVDLYIKQLLNELRLD